MGTPLDNTGFNFQVPKRHSCCFVFLGVCFETVIILMRLKYTLAGL